MAEFEDLISEKSDLQILEETIEQVKVKLSELDERRRQHCIKLINQLEGSRYEENDKNQELAKYILDVLTGNVSIPKYQRYEIPEIGFFDVDNEGNFVNGDQNLYDDWANGLLNNPDSLPKPRNWARVAIIWGILLPMIVLGLNQCNKSIIRPINNYLVDLKSDYTQVDDRYNQEQKDKFGW